MGVPTVFTWQDADAPVLTSEPGTMVALLRACLVDGLDVGGPEEKPALGWEMAMDPNSNQRCAWRSTDPSSSRHWLYIDDTGTIGAGGDRWARGWGAHNFVWDASDNPQLTDQYPTAAQSSFGTTWAKNTIDQDTTPIAWILIGDEKTFYLVVDHQQRANLDPNETFPNRLSAHGFGDYECFTTNPDNCFISAGNEENEDGPPGPDNWPLCGPASRSGRYIARAFDGVLSRRVELVTRFNSVGYNSDLLDYQNQSIQTLIASPIHVSINGDIYGKFLGFLNPFAYAANKDDIKPIFGGSAIHGPIAGNTYYLLPQDPGMFLVSLGDWDA